LYIGLATTEEVPDQATFDSGTLCPEAQEKATITQLHLFSSANVYHLHSSDTFLCVAPTPDDEREGFIIHTGSTSIVS
jgi:hypothetical protein